MHILPIMMLLDKWREYVVNNKMFKSPNSMHRIKSYGLTKLGGLPIESKHLAPLSPNILNHSIGKETIHSIVGQSKKPKFCSL
jgi:hypothetical protein